MEVIRAGTPHALFPMGDASRIGEARRHAAQLAQRLALTEVDAGRLALVVTELGSNLVRHARQGRLLIGLRQHGLPEVELVALDDGPGIDHLPRVLADGFSTGGTPGLGLGGVQRMASDFHIHSEPGVGTALLARVRPQGMAPPAQAFRWGALSVCAPGEQVCGDAWALALDGDRAAVLLADGLGHGPQAAEAAQTAVAQFACQPFAALATQFERMHAAMRSTRGAAVSVALLAPDSLELAGAGNIVTRVLSGTYDKGLPPQHGTLGLQVRRTQAVRAPWPAHALAVLHSDGVHSRWPASLLAPLVTRDPTLVAAWLLRSQLRGRDDASIVVLQRSSDGR